LPGRNHRGARRIETPADGKSRMCPPASQCVQARAGGTVAGLPPRNMRCDEAGHASPGRCRARPTFTIAISINPPFCWRFAGLKIINERASTCCRRNLYRSNGQDHHMKRCYQCNGRFGLIRYRFAQRQFCSKQCVGKFKASAEREASRLKGWIAFLARKL
jgi:hypothetical protein